MTELNGHRVYFDANAFIYFLDQHPRYADLVTPIFEAAYAGQLEAVTGQIAVAEVMVGPYRSGDQRIIDRTAAFFETPNLLDIRPHGRREFDDAARLRGRTSLLLVDAVHVATARRGGCDYFVTNDARIRSESGLTVVHIEAMRSGE